MYRKDGFTLIEISIVIVIIGLIIGGVMAGRTLIRASELRGLISEINQFQAAYTTFKLKYQCVPGDCSNASTYFGTANACNGTTITTGACNGNGNGKMDTGYSSYLEELWGMQHLLAASLISFPISSPGSSSAGGGNPNWGGVAMQSPGINAAASNKDPRIGFFTRYLTPGTTCSSDYTWNAWVVAWAPYCTAGNYLSVGSMGMYGVMGDATGYANIMSNAEVSDIDTKMDDNMPNTGTILCLGQYTCGSGTIYLKTTNYTGSTTTNVSLLYKFKD